MNRQFSLFCAFILVAALAAAIPGYAADSGKASATEVAAAIKSYESIAADPAKRKAYCEMVQYTEQAMKYMGSDQARFADANTKATAAMNKLGAEFTQAHNLAARLDYGSESSRRYAAAKSALESRCTGK